MLLLPWSPAPQSLTSVKLFTLRTWTSRSFPTVLLLTHPLIVLLVV